MPSLLPVLGPLKKEPIELTIDEIIIGRDASCTLPVGDLHLSRRHCAIRTEGNARKIVDLDSRNGIMVNGVPVRERTLEHADKIEIGGCLFIYTAVEELSERLEEFKENTITLSVAEERLIIGESPSVQKVMQLIRKVAPSDSSVLITGESGTGKELVARALHFNSPRNQNPFVAINCAAIPETLLESELFGHEKGAFSGAIATKKGKFEIADTGTIFLDEIAEMVLPLQSKLLRVLQEREIDRLGSTSPISIDVRLIAATNKDLEKLVSEGKFRSDLYYRLNVVKIDTPSLRTLGEDILLLARYFAFRISSKFRKPVVSISPEAQECLIRYEWPGNTRELENAIEHAVVLMSGDTIRPEDLPEAIVEVEHSGRTQIPRFHDAVKEFKKDLIIRAFEEANENYQDAAAKLGIHRNYLYRLVTNLKLKDRLKIK